MPFFRGKSYRPVYHIDSTGERWAVLEVWHQGNQLWPEAAGDHHFDKVVLLVRFNGEDGATSAVDLSNSGHTLTFVGNAQIDASISKFGGGSLRLDGAGDRVTIPDSDDWDLHPTATAPFTIEGHVNPDDMPTTNAQELVLSQWPGGGVTGDAAFQFGFENNGSNLYFNFHDGTQQVKLSGGVTILADTWNHVAVDFDGETLRLYANGEVVASRSGMAPMQNGSVPLVIGAGQAGGAFAFDGWAAEFRITKGVARYAGPFTPPSQPFAQA